MRFLIETNEVNHNMICYCTHCHYTFESTGDNTNAADITLPDRCPDCGKTHVIRPAMEQEIVEYERIRREIELEENICAAS